MYKLAVFRSSVCCIPGGLPTPRHIWQWCLRASQQARNTRCRCVCNDWSTHCADDWPCRGSALNSIEKNRQDSLGNASTAPCILSRAFRSTLGGLINRRAAGFWKTRPSGLALEQGRHARSLFFLGSTFRRHYPLFRTKASPRCCKTGVRRKRRKNIENLPAATMPRLSRDWTFSFLTRYSLTKKSPHTIEKAESNPR